MLMTKEDEMSAKRRTTRTIVILTATFLVLAGNFLPGQQNVSGSRLSLERIFNSSDFAAERFGPARWMKDGISYTTLEDSEAIKGGRDIVLYQAATGKREILVPASKLVPAGESVPLAIENYDRSNDGKLLLVFTNSKRVWRQNTRGDFWVLNLASGLLKKLGAEFEPSTLQFAKFAPAGRRAAYVRKNDIYAEDLDSGRIVRLTWDGSETTSNGTFDWVYEEEIGRAHV
jgi:dipeptidyl-peptidase-4